MANYRVHAVAVDENWYSEKAFQYADNTYDKAEPFVLIYGEYKGWPGFDPSPARRDAEEIRKVYMEKCAQSSRECAFRKLVYQTSKELADGICRTAADSGASDITIGSRGLGALGRAILGSTGENLTRDCPIPLNVVKPAEGDPNYVPPRGRKPAPVYT